MRRTWATHLMDRRSDGNWMCINCHFLAADAAVTGQLPPPGAPQPPACSGPGFTGMGINMLPPLPPSPQTWHGHFIAQRQPGATWECLDCKTMFSDLVVSGASQPVGRIPVCTGSPTLSGSALAAQMFTATFPPRAFSLSASAEAEPKREGLCEECGRELCEFLDAYYGPDRWKAGFCATCRPADKDAPSVADDYD